jgi:C-terminal processing protease CtpA/Prc
LQNCRIAELPEGKGQGLRPSLSAILQSILPAIAWVLIPAALFSQAAPSLSKRDRDLVLTMLRSARADVEKHYYDPSFHGVDLKAQLSKSEQRLKSAASLVDAFSIVSDFLSQFGDSHTVFIPPTSGRSVDYGWQMAMVGDRALITDVEPGSDAAARGLAPGDRVLLLNGITPSRGNASRIGYYYRYIRPQTRQRVAVLKPDGSAVTVDVVSRLRGRRLIDEGDVVSEANDLIERGRDRGAVIGSTVLVWKMVVFARPESVDQMMDRAASYQALVLDLRGNGGGSVDALRELVSRCFDRDIVVAVETRRDGKGAPTIARPTKNPFGGRLIVLVDSRSASAAEMFARIAQIEKRGQVLGDVTAGAVMRSRLISHRAESMTSAAPYGTSVTVADVHMSDGGSLENVGVEPDEIVLPTQADLATGRDPVLARAIELAGETVSPEEAGRLFK